jgi:hypothetical protein
MSPITFKHGPVTITVEGLPEMIDPERVVLEVGLHTQLGVTDAEAIETFVRHFHALGGSKTFPRVKPGERFSCCSKVRGNEAGEPSGHRSELLLYAPDSAGIDAAIESERDAVQPGER